MEGLFWVLLVLSMYSYAIYPALLGLIPPRTIRAVNPAGPARGTLPRISLIVTAHNEMARLPEKIDNCRSLVYPRDRLEIIVASDASTDGTDDLVRAHAEEGFALARAEQRLGKEYAQSVALGRASGEIIVFSDVATAIPPHALQHLASLFEDPSLGAVSSVDRFHSADGSVAGEGAYVRYEMWLRSRESVRGGLIGLSGSFFACRREVCEPWDIQGPSDFNVALNSRRLGLRAISSPSLVGIYRDLADPAGEYGRKVRTGIRGMAGLVRHPEFLHPRYGVFAFQLWSHKVMRWLVPWFLLALTLVSFAVWDEGAVYQAALVGQLAFYGVVVTGHLWPSSRQNTLVRLLYYFVQANVALAEAAVRFSGGQRVSVWQPSLR